MDTAILVIHVLGAMALIGLVLIQQGKGADAGAAFGGGSSQSVFGSSGATSFLTKVTVGVAVLFFCTSLGLALLSKYKSEGSEFSIGAEPAAETVEAEETDVPQVTVTPIENESDVPSVDVEVLEEKAAEAESDIPVTQ